MGFRPDELPSERGIRKTGSIHKRPNTSDVFRHPIFVCVFFLNMNTSFLFSIDVGLLWPLLLHGNRYM